MTILGKEERHAVAILACMAAICSPMLAQQASEEPVMRYGLSAAVSYNGAINDIGPLFSVPQDPLYGGRDFRGADGFAGYGGFTAVFAPVGTFGGTIRAAIDDRRLSRKNGEAELATNMLYLGIEPGVRIGIASRRFAISGGPTIEFPLRSRYTYQWSDALGSHAISDAAIPDVRRVAVGLWGEIGCDLLVSSPTASFAWYVTPFIQGSYLFDQKKENTSEASGQEWGTMTVRAGLSVTLGKRRVPEEAERIQTVPPVEMSFTIVPPSAGITRPRQLVERMPLLDAIFFPLGTTEIPTRYVTIGREEVGHFDERVLQESPGTGAQGKPGRAERQLAAYRNILNILGSRMAARPATTIMLVGAATDTAVAGRMAAAVKEYLVSVFGIDPRRVTTRGALQPPHPSGTSATPEEDLDLVAEENNRVQILPSDPDLLGPVEVYSTMDEAFDNDLRLTAKCEEPIENWSVTITGNGFKRTYGPYYAPLQRINAESMLGNAAQGTYVAQLFVRTRRGTIGARESTFVLTRREQTPSIGHRYAVLFDFDEAGTIDLYERFLRTTVATNIPDGGSAFVHGHTDEIGDEEHNRELSARRALRAELILEDEVKQEGKSAVFDVYGFGENPTRALFPNDIPEGRFYNRTVTVDVISPEH